MSFSKYFAINLLIMLTEKKGYSLSKIRNVSPPFFGCLPKSNQLLDDERLVLSHEKRGLQSQ